MKGGSKLFPTESYALTDAMPALYTAHRDIILEMYNQHIVHSESRSDFNTAPHVAQWLSTPTVIMMLGALAESSNTNNKKIAFEHCILRLTDIGIAALDNPYSLPDWLIHSNFSSENTLCRIKLIHIRTGVRAFNKLDEHPELNDLKHVSLSLQTSRDHRIRTYLKDNQLIIVTTQYTWGLLFKIIALLPNFFPQLETKESLKDMLYAFGNQDYTTWIARYTAWLNTQDCIVNKRKYDLQKTLNTKRALAKRKAEQDICTHLSTIEQALRVLANHYELLEQSRLTLHALNTQEDDISTEFYDYLQKHAYIKAFAVEPPILRLHLEVPLQYYDVNVLKATLNNHRSKLHTDPFLNWLFTKTFIDRTYICYTETVAQIDFNNNRVRATDRTYLMHRLFPQPHLMAVDCWGTNEPFIVKALSEYNPIQAVEQIIASAANLNFADAFVVDHFIRYCYERQDAKTFQYCEDKQFYSINDLYAVYRKETPNETN